MEANVSLFDDMCQVLVAMDVISFNAATSACEKGGQWQQALPLLDELHMAASAGNGSQGVRNSKCDQL